MPDGGFMVDEGVFRARVARDGTVVFLESDATVAPPNGVVLSAYDDIRIPELKWTLDVNDTLYRSIGADPYLARKRSFLAETREERWAMARAARRADLAAALEALPSRLDRIWSSGRPLEERKRLLFELWDECAGSEDEEALGSADRVRAAIEDFVRSHLPRGSPGAYTDAELAALDAGRTSPRPFRPYDDPG